MGKEVVLNWQNPSIGITEQRIYRSVDGGEEVLVAVVAATDESFTDPVVGTPSTLTYKVGSVYVKEGTEYSEYSDPITLTIPTTTEITTSYDSFLQTMTVNGIAGTPVETKDINNNTIGSGTIDASGSTTYSLNEDNLTDGASITTSGENTNVVNNTMLTSSKFLFEVTTADYICSVGTYMDNTPINGRLRIDWGDGTPQQIITIAEADENWGDWYSHTYATPGNYILKVRAEGVWDGIEVRDHHKLLDWGHCTDYTIKNASSVFYEVVPTNISPLLTSAKGMFGSATIFNQDISGWNVSNVTDMSQMFRSATAFNQDLSQWCVPGEVAAVDFAEGSSLQLIHFPVWGTCPRGEVPVVTITAPGEPYTVGNTYQLTYNYNQDPGTVTSVEWASNTGAVTVDNTGLMTAVSVGDAFVSVTINGTVTNHIYVVVSA